MPTIVSTAAFLVYNARQQDDHWEDTTHDTLEQENLGQSLAERHRLHQAESLSRNGSRRLAQPRPVAVRLAHPQPRRLRWLRVGDDRAARLHDGGRAPLHGAARVAALEHHAGARR